MKHFLLVILGVAVAGLVFGQAVPPMNLAAEVLTAGQVELTWDEPPPGLVESFDADPGTAWNWLYVGGTLVFDGGYAKMDVTGTNAWGTGAYEMLEFDNFALDCTFEIQDTQTSSRGVMWCTNGPRDADFQGYGCYVSSTSYSVWKYTAGSASSIISWTTGTGINTGIGAVNQMHVDGSNGTYDIYINGTYHNSFTDASYPQGYVGVIEAYNITWWDEITCFFGAAAAPDAPAYHGTPVEGCFDDMHNPVDTPLPVAEGVRVFDRYGQSGGNALDELLGYRIYRDGAEVGAVGPATLSFIDTMPTLNETYEYTVTAVYDPEGESSPAGPLYVTWEPVYLDLIGQITEIPASGGSMYYDAHVLNTLPTTFSQGVTYKTYVQFPNAQVFGPLSMQPVVIQGYMNTTVNGLFLTLPAHAPAGDYVFRGRLGTNNMYLEDTVDFTKLPSAADSWVSDPSTWPQNHTLTLEDLTTPVSAPVGYALSAAYPNPFNPSTSISVTMPEAGELAIVVYNIQGRQVATLTQGQLNAGRHTFTFNADGLASGLYFVHAVVPGQLDQIQKVTLLR